MGYTHSLGRRTVNIYFVHHAEVIRCEYKMVYYFDVRRSIQNLLQMIMAQGFPAWAEEGISRATGVVRLILILVQNDREGKKKKKKKLLVPIALVLVVLGLRQKIKKLPFHDVHDVGVSALKLYIVAAGDHRCPDAVDAV